MSTYADAELIELGEAELYAYAGELFPDIPSSVLGAIPADSLVIDCLIQRWRADPQLIPPGYALGHAHGHNAEADLEIKRGHTAQLAENARRHVSSGHARGLERAVERANHAAKQEFNARIEAALEGRAVPADPGERVAIEARVAAEANEAARERGREIIEAWERGRDRERAEIAGMADRLARSAPAPEGEEGGERGILLDLQSETWDEEAGRWNTARLYRWVTYAEIREGGPALLAGMRAELDDLAADADLVGPLRLGMAGER